MSQHLGEAAASALRCVLSRSCLLDRAPTKYWCHRTCPCHDRAMPAPRPRHPRQKKWSIARATPAPCPRHARATVLFCSVLFCSGLCCSFLF
eukprot:gene12548-biopygen18494